MSRLQPSRLPTSLLRLQQTRLASTTPPPRPTTTTKRPTRRTDEIHRPSLSGSSVGHLISEISGMKPGMEGLRPEGQTMSEEQRTFARRVVTWVMGVPVVLGVGLVGGNWVLKRSEGAGWNLGW